MPWPHQKPTKTNSLLQMETKQLQREHINKENFWKTCIKLSKFWQKHSPKLESGLLRIYSLQCLTQNSLKGRVRQPLCDLRDIRKMDKWENQSLDDLLDLGPKTLGCFTRCHWSTSHPHSLTNGDSNSSCLQPWNNYGDWGVTNSILFFHGSPKSISLN